MMMADRDEMLEGAEAARLWDENDRLQAEVERLRAIEAAALSAINGPSLDRRTSQWLNLRRALNGENA